MPHFLSNIVNDIEIISMGEVGRTKEEYTPELQSKWGAFKPDDKGNAKIVIEVANFDNFRGGLWLKPRVGEFQVLKNMAVTRSAFETALFNSMLLMGLFLLGLYAKTLNEKSTFLGSAFTAYGFESSLYRLSSCYNCFACHALGLL